MGMFDTISFEYSEQFATKIKWGKHKVPAEVVRLIKENNIFQTKDLDKALFHYLISFEGHLKSQHFEEYQYINDSGLPVKLAIQKKGEYWMNEDFHGSINIIPDTFIDFLDQDWFVEFNLKFADGVLEAIECIHSSSQCNIERKALAEQITEEYKKRYALRKGILDNKLLRLYAGFYVYPMMRVAFKKIQKYPKFKKLIKILLTILVPFYWYF